VKIKFLVSGCLRRVVWSLDTNASEDHAASIFSTMKTSNLTYVLNVYKFFRCSAKLLEFKLRDNLNNRGNHDPELKLHVKHRGIYKYIYYFKRRVLLNVIHLFIEVYL